MVYVVKKLIKGRYYNYQVKSVREGKKVKTVFVAYLGPAGGGSSLGTTTAPDGTVSPNQVQDKPMLGTTPKPADTIQYQAEQNNKALGTTPNRPQFASQPPKPLDLKSMDETTLKRKQREYDNAVNEGGEGFNPYHEELQRRQIEAYNNPKTLNERMMKLSDKEYSLLSIMAGTSTNDPRYEQLSSELKSVQEQYRNLKGQRLINDGWTLEKTSERRALWNKAIKDGEVSSTDPRTQNQEIKALENKLGFSMADLKIAIDYYSQLGTTVNKIIKSSDEKASWETTRDEWIKSPEAMSRVKQGFGYYKHRPETNTDAALMIHEYDVSQAIKSGKNVPSEVIKDYPDIGLS